MRDLPPSLAPIRGAFVALAAACALGAAAQVAPPPLPPGSVMVKVEPGLSKPERERHERAHHHKGHVKKDYMRDDSVFEAPVPAKTAKEKSK